MATFQLLSEEEMNDLIGGVDSASTKRSVKYGFSKFENFVKFTGRNSMDLTNSTTKEELDSLLCQFYATARKDDGSNYTKKTMQTIRYAVQRHFLDKRGFNICENAQFPKSNKVFKGVLVKLKKEGKGNVKHKSPISPQDMEKIQGSIQLDCATPIGLQNKVFIDVLTYFCNRGRENIRSMKPSDFDVGTDENGLRYISKKDGLTKNNREDVDEQSNSGLMFEIPSSDRCPVKAYLLYISKLNPKCPCLWQKPKSAVPQIDGEPWYVNVPLGVNTIANKLKDISQKAGCSKVYTNHCIRATCISSLDSAGFESRDIMTVSGHRSASSLKHYSKTSDARKKEMSQQLSHQLGQRQVQEQEQAPVPTVGRAQVLQQVQPVPAAAPVGPAQVQEEVPRPVPAPAAPVGLAPGPGPGPGQHQSSSGSRNMQSAEYSKQYQVFHNCEIHFHN